MLEPSFRPNSECDYVLLTVLFFNVITFNKWCSSAIITSSSNAVTYPPTAAIAS